MTSRCRDDVFRDSEVALWVSAASRSERNSSLTGLDWVGGCRQGDCGSPMFSASAGIHSRTFSCTTRGRKKKVLTGVTSVLNAVLNVEQISMTHPAFLAFLAGRAGLQRDRGGPVGLTDGRKGERPEHTTPERFNL